MAAKLIILFAKSPQPGRVKTRLLPVLAPHLAAELHYAFVEDMIRRFHNLDDASFELHTDTESDAWADIAVTRKLQISGDLGLKMVHALGSALQSGYTRVLLLGSDAPTLPLAHVRALLETASDVALGPADDGGYYGISAKRIHPEMFAGVPWSTAETLQRTEDAVRRCGLSIQTGPSWFDIDEPADLRRLLAERELPPATAAWLQRAKALQGISIFSESAGLPDRGPAHPAKAASTSPGPHEPA